jgi:hypothetical protein
MLKIDSLTRSDVGRRDGFFGVANFRPFDVPLMMRINDKPQIQNYKSQIPDKFQSPNFQMTKTILFRISNFGHWKLFGVWCL